MISLRKLIHHLVRKLPISREIRTLNDQIAIMQEQMNRMDEMAVDEYNALNARLFQAVGEKPGSDKLVKELTEKVDLLQKELTALKKTQSRSSKELTRIGNKVQRLTGDKKPEQKPEEPKSETAKQPKPDGYINKGDIDEARVLKTLSNIKLKLHEKNSTGCFGYKRTDDGLVTPDIDEISVIFRWLHLVQNKMSEAKAYSLVIEEIGGMFANTPLLDQNRTIDDCFVRDVMRLSPDARNELEDCLKAHYVKLRQQWHECKEAHPRGDLFDRGLMNELKRVAVKTTNRVDRAKALNEQTLLKDRFGNSWNTRRLCVEESYLKSRYGFVIPRKKGRSLTPEEVETALDMDAKGLDSSEIAIGLNTSASVIGGILANERKKQERI